MIFEAFDSLQQLLRSFRLADLVDIVLVGLLLYPLLGWLRSGASSLATRRAFVLALVFSTVYLLARSFEMYMIEGLLEALSVVLLVAVVVVFQQELRRFLNRFGTWNPFRSDAPDTSHTAEIDELVAAAKDLADQKIGALIALKGYEPWEDHLDGGVMLDGVVSRPLLYSLFNPDTPGHDGAVLIENARITSFGVHLPLARELPEASQYGGTRHAAAVGLSEQCDALTIVVSEERGVISVAEGGRLDLMETTADLEARLEAFWQRGQPAGRSKWFPRWLTTSLLSLSASAFLWLLFAYSPGTVFQSFEVPVQVRNVPEDWALGAVEPSTVQITLRGPERAFNLLQDETLAVAFDFESLEAGENDLTVNARSLSLPTTLELYDVDSREVSVTAHRLVAFEVAVEVPTVGSVRGELTLAGLQPEPDQVTVLVREGTEQPRQILTQPVDLRNIEASGTIERSLVVPAGWRLPADADADITVSVELQQD
jgi:uncharacterized protein (TIGR00159 family)